MKGLECSRRYFETYGLPMLKDRFADYLPLMAAGLIGRGSDVLGLDDELSTDHDHGPGFCLFVPRFVYDRIGDQLTQAYQSLPETFEGMKRIVSANGTGRVGVLVTEDFFAGLLGDHALTYEEAAPPKPPLVKEINWPIIAESDLLAATSGQIFMDHYGQVTGIRKALREYYPHWLWLLKIAEETAKTSGEGQYNYRRLIQRKDLVSASFAKNNCCLHALRLLFLLNRTYAPHDKWLITMAARLQDSAKALSCIRKIATLPAIRSDETARAIEDLCLILQQKMLDMGLISEVRDFLHDQVPALRAAADQLHMSREDMVETIVKLEFSAFDKVHNIGGRAYCQNDWPTFSIMRRSQYMTWTEEMLLCYLDSFEAGLASGRNPIADKYAYMMKTNDPEGFEKIRDTLPPLSDRQMQIIEAIVSLQVGMMESFVTAYPHLGQQARSLRTVTDDLWDTSYETYLRGELSTYSEPMLRLYAAFVANKAKNGQNLAYEIMTYTVKAYGYASLEEANAKNDNRA